MAIFDASIYKEFLFDKKESIFPNKSVASFASENSASWYFQGHVELSNNQLLLLTLNEFDVGLVPALSNCTASA